MIESVPVRSSIQIVNDEGRYTNNHIMHTASHENVLMFGKALNGLQYRAPAERFVRVTRYEIKQAG